MCFRHCVLDQRLLEMLGLEYISPYSVVFVYSFVLIYIFNDIIYAKYKNTIIVTCGKGRRRVGERQARTQGLQLYFQKTLL